MNLCITYSGKRRNLKRLKTMKIKDKVNKTQLFRDLTEIGKKRFEFTCEPDEDLKVFLDGAEQLFKLLRLPVVVSTSCDLSKEQLKRKIQMADMEHQIKRELPKETFYPRNSPYY